LKKVIFLVFLVSYSVSSFSQNIDIEILRSINSSATLPSDDFFRFISNSEIYVGLGIPAGMAAAGLFNKDDKLLNNACVTFASAALTSGISTLLKYSINRDRPFVTYPDITRKTDVNSPSFPSGHTSNAFSTATSVSLAYPKWYIIVPSFAWAGTVGYSRMALGVHYPSDVLAGAIIGSGTAWLTYRINKKLKLKSSVKH
jgi:membrane-associated phospholipid phosphatase